MSLISDSEVSPREGSTVPASDIRQLKVILIFRDVIQKVFRLVLIWGCDKPAEMTFADYLLNTKGLSRLRFKRYFNKDAIYKMEHDLEGKTFDLTLLYNCIQLACHSVAEASDPIWVSSSDTLEGALHSMKSHRNRIVHESVFSNSDFKSDELLNFVNDIRKHLKFILEQAGFKFSISKANVEEEIDRINKSIDEIMDMHNEVFDLEKLIISRGKLELKKFFEHVIHLNLFYALHIQSSVKVTEIFTDLILMKLPENPKSNVEVKIEDLLDTKNHKGEYPTVIVLEGLAGSGKTTLVKYIISQWLSENASIKNLNLFDLLLYVECRNRTFTNIRDLLQSLMPKTCSEIPDWGIIGAVFSLKNLIVIDGFDEINPNTHCLLIELLEKLGTNNTMLVTTRPEKSDMLHTMIPAPLEICRLKLSGLLPEKRYEFVHRYHNSIQNYQSSHRENVTELTNLIVSSPWLSDILKSPFNLTLIFHLWFHSGLLIGCKTSTELYLEMMNLTKCKLKERLCNHRVTKDMSYSLIDKCLTDFIHLMCNECLIAISEERMVLTDESIKKLSKNCLESNIPMEEVFSAFFLEIKTEGHGLKILAVPHANFRDFYAALYICNTLKSDDSLKSDDLVSVDEVVKLLSTFNVSEGESSKMKEFLEKNVSKLLQKETTIINILKSSHRDPKEPFRLPRYQKTLLHLPVLLKDSSSHFNKELIHLLKELKLDPEDWLNVISGTGCDSAIVDEIKDSFPKNFMRVKDCHLEAAAALLQHVEVYYVDIDISSDPAMLPQLMTVLKVLSTNNTQVKLSLQHNWRYPEKGCSDDYLQCLTKISNGRATFAQFMGSVKSLSSLDKALDCLFLAIGNDYAKCQHRDPLFLENMTDLEHLYIHISRGIPIDCLPEITHRKYPIDLWMSEVDDSASEWVDQVMKRLENKRLRKLSDASKKFGMKKIISQSDFWSIRFPRSSLSIDGCKELAKVLKGFMIGKDGIMVSSSKINKEDFEMLKMIYNTETNCTFRLSDEMSIWTFSPTSP